MRCGLCLPHCPTYRLGREEGESPRGRIALAAALARAPALAADPGLGRHLGSCLACGACERVCPAEVRFDALLVEARRRIAASRPHARGGCACCSPCSPARAPGSSPSPCCRALDRTPLAGLASRLGLRPPGRRPAEPTPPRWRPAARGEGRPVYLFGGCVGERFDRDALAAAERLLTPTRLPRPRRPSAGVLWQRPRPPRGRRGGRPPRVSAALRLPRQRASARPALRLPGHGARDPGRAGARHPRVPARGRRVGDGSASGRRAPTVVLHRPCTLRGATAMKARRWRGC
ncbi:MAG: (Fe-S)-binding protein [Xanthomonadales bacterium]|nr:(Fe-S)-binding protein [Xanthomonadales bacterium]